MKQEEIENRIRESHKNMAKDSKEGLHTQGEWNNNLHDGNVYGSNGIVIANCYSSLLMPATIKANAEQIVKAVNERKALLDALTIAKIVLRRAEKNQVEGATEALNEIKTVLNNAKNI